MKVAPPVVDAWVIAGDGSPFRPDVAVLWCDHCARWHTHGAMPGHRVAHCDDLASFPHGYVLRIVGTTTAEGIEGRRGAPDPSSIGALEPTIPETSEELDQLREFEEAP
jgi:hypothetical protein